MNVTCKPSRDYVISHVITIANQSPWLASYAGSSTKMVNYFQTAVILKDTWFSYEISGLLAISHTLNIWNTDSVTKEGCFECEFSEALTNPLNMSAAVRHFFNCDISTVIILRAETLAHTDLTCFLEVTFVCYRNECRAKCWPEVLAGKRPVQGFYWLTVLRKEIRQILLSPRQEN